MRFPTWLLQPRKNRLPRLGARWLVDSSHFDFAMSLLAFLVALMYVWAGPQFLPFAVIPLFGLRYSYGVNYELKQLNTRTFFAC